MEAREAEDAREERRSESNEPRRRRFKYGLAVIALVMVSVISVAGSAAPAEASNHRLAPSVNDCSVFGPVLKEGHQGGCVAAAQAFFAFAHYPTPIAVDGIFGPQTEDHVQVFRAANGSPGTIIEPAVWFMMGVWCSNNSPGVCSHQTRY